MLSKYLAAGLHEVLEERGYVSPDEKDAVLELVIQNPLPYQGDFEERVRWAEFIRAIKERDFARGDILTLNGTSFEVVRGDK